MNKQNPIRAHDATKIRYFSDRLLVLLCHKRWLTFLLRETAWQHGHRYKDLARAIVSRLRIVAIEFST